VHGGGRSSGEVARGGHRVRGPRWPRGRTPYVAAPRGDTPAAAPVGYGPTTVKVPHMPDAALGLPLWIRQT
jgi:hypothetical protein